jgi:uncharacterized membrane protein YqjE
MSADTAPVHDRGIFPLLMSMLSTRVELAALDAEAHLEATLRAMMLTFIAVVLSLITFAFIGVIVIVVCWDSHRIAAATGVLVAYASIAIICSIQARSAWRRRPAAFDATLHELDLDRAAFRSRL